MADPEDKGFGTGGTYVEGGALGYLKGIAAPALGLVGSNVPDAWLHLSAMAEHHGVAPQGFTGAALPRLHDIEQNAPEYSQGVGELVGGAAGMFLGGKVVGGFVNPGQHIAQRVLGSGVKAGVLGGAIDGAAYGALNSGVEQAGQDLLNDGKINEEHVAAAQWDGVKWGGVAGGVLGGVLSLVSHHGASGLRKGADVAEREAGIGYLQRSGVKDPVKLAGGRDEAGALAKEYYTAAQEYAGQGKPAKPLADLLEKEADTVRGGTASKLKEYAVGFAEREQAVKDSFEVAKSRIQERAGEAQAGVSAEFRGASRNLVREQGAKVGPVVDAYTQEAVRLQYELENLRAINAPPRESVPVSAKPAASEVDTGMGPRAKLERADTELAGPKTLPTNKVEPAAPAQEDVALLQGRAERLGKWESALDEQAAARRAKYRDFAAGRDMRLGEAVLPGKGEPQGLVDQYGRPAARVTDTKRIAQIEARLQEIQVEQNAATEKAMRPFQAKFARLGKGAGAKLEAIGKAATKEEIQAQKLVEKAAKPLAEANTKLAQLLDDPGSSLDDFLKLAKELEHTHPAEGQAMRLAVQDAKSQLNLNSALRDSIAAPALNDPWSLLKRIRPGAAASAVGYATGIGPLGSVALGAVGKLADSKLSPDFYMRGVQHGAGAMRAIAKRFEVDTAAGNALRKLSSSTYTPMAGSIAVSYGVTGHERDRVLAGDVARVSAISGAANTEELAAKLDTMPLPRALKEAALGKSVQVANNIQRKLPMPVVLGGQFGSKPRYADTDVMDFEEYVSAATDPLSAIQALQDGSLTMAQAEAMRDNYPEMVQQVRNSLLDHTDSPMDEQAIRKLELFFGEPLIVEHSDEYIKLLQQNYEQEAKTNQEGSQGGGSMAGESNGKDARTQDTQTATERQDRR